MGLCVVRKSEEWLSGRGCPFTQGNPRRLLFPRNAMTMGKLGQISGPDRLKMETKPRLVCICYNNAVKLATLISQWCKTTGCFLQRSSLCRASQGMVGSGLGPGYRLGSPCSSWASSCLFTHSFHGGGRSTGGTRRTITGVLRPSPGDEWTVTSPHIPLAKAGPWRSPIVQGWGSVLPPHWPCQAGKAGEGESQRSTACFI